MYVGLKQPRGDGERYVTPARAAAKETKSHGTPIVCLIVLPVFILDGRSFSTDDPSGRIIRL